MFERYTEKARRTMFFSRYEASQFGSRYIESEHLLLGLLRADEALVNAFSHGGFETIRRQAEQQTPFRDEVPYSIDLSLSSECKHILAYAVKEADELSQKFISTEHLFLGVLREQDCLAAKLLRERGIALETAREQIGSNSSEQLGPIRSACLPAGYKAHRLMYNKASETLILELRASSRVLLPTRLFVRHKDKEAYEQIGGPSEAVSCESSVTCESFPLVMFNSLKRGKLGADWEGVYSYNLNSKELKLCISPQHLQFSEAHGRLSISELVSLSEDAQTLCVNIAVEKIVAGGGIIHHYLAKVDLRDQQVSLLSRLLDARF